uniref:Ig-like domain-containing protein n=1 Tax=Gadus morhua TaxID=8049 RepID=A0A8C5FST3_GADMO
MKLRCTYEYPDNVQYRPNTVRTLWFTKGDKYQPVDLEHDTDYTGRVESSCGEVSCTGSRCHGTYLQVKVSFLYPTSPTWAELECHSMCGLAGDPPYIWIRNGQNVGQGINYWEYIQSDGSYSCAVEGYKRVTSPLVCKIKYPTPSVTVSPSGEIEEGSSVTLRCSSDANPAAEYTWFKVISAHSSREMKQGVGPHLVFRSILSADSGQYYCLVQTELRTKSEFIDITLICEYNIYLTSYYRYPPKTPSVTVIPSGEIEEGSSVTLNCSSDAVPAAEYTWFKNNQPLHWGPSQPHTFPSVRPEDRGTYRCHAENKYGHLSSNSIFMDVQCELNICLICKNRIYI